MNELQTRLLLEAEYQFYQLQLAPPGFAALLQRCNFKVEPVVDKLDNVQLKRLNICLRSALRNPTVGV